MVSTEEDYDGLQTTNLKKVDIFFLKIRFPWPGSFKDVSAYYLCAFLMKVRMCAPTYKYK